MDSDKSTLRREIKTRLIAQASQDEQFAADLRRDPRAAVQREMKTLGVAGELPGDVEITVLEETPTTMYLVLPKKALRPDGELSDEELERVAGGAAGPFCICMA